MTDSREDLVIRTDRGAVSYLTLNQPRRGNALSLAMIDALHQRLLELRSETHLGAIVLSAAGARIFCAGHDLAEFNDETCPEFFKAVSVRCSAMMQAIREQPQIVVARVEGIATAAGCQLVASADLAIAASDAKFATPGVNIGLWCLTPMVALGRAVLPKHAMQMLATGRLFDADFAMRIGLVNQVVPLEELDATVDALTGEIASKSTYTLALGKQAFYRQLSMPLTDAYEYCGEVVARNMAHADAREGIRAFVEKRRPEWIGRQS